MDINKVSPAHPPTETEGIGKSMTPNTNSCPGEANLARKYTDFGIAIAHLRRGRKVARSGWNGKGMWVKLQIPDSGSKMSLPYIYMKTADNELVPWIASQSDVLAWDWEVVPD